MHSKNKNKIISILKKIYCLLVEYFKTKKIKYTDYTYFSTFNLYIYIGIQIFFFVIFIIIYFTYIYLIFKPIFEFIPAIFNIAFVLLFIQFRKFDVYIKEKDKNNIRRNIDIHITTVDKYNLNEILSNIISESKIIKKSLENELNNSILLNFISSLLGFIVGISSKIIYDITTLFFLIVLFLGNSLLMYFLVEIIRYNKIYKIEMYEYQIFYSTKILKKINKEQ
ncbi:hypothetical protein J2Z80_000343 [Thermoanaerobacterium butyriciformans]|uniref:ABC transporter ATP-binding protein n=2 Tax=Thermoanaerobacterium butyriciformans TaxID=1702242 RepID=A0ABS4NAZ1_9THEO|nr:hypothetical protein [Thermoanaerobacterium butyriciformans]